MHGKKNGPDGDSALMMTDDDEDLNENMELDKMMTWDYRVGNTKEKDD